MKRILFCFSALLFASMAKPTYADDYEIQFLAAACSLVNRPDAKVVVTAQGPGVQHRDGSLKDVIILCPINADVINFFNWLQLVAEDNTPNGYAEATLWRMNTYQPMPAQALYRVTTVDQPGVQIAVNYDVYDTLDVENYVYWIEIRIVRTSADAVVTVYSVGLLNVF
jgi:hypothetical protein